MDTKSFYFDIYVDGKVRWRAFLLALGLSFHARVMDRAVPGDSSIKEQHDNNNVALHSSHGIMHVINDGVASRLCAFFCARCCLGGKIFDSSTDFLTTVNDWKRCETVAHPIYGAGDFLLTT